MRIIHVINTLQASDGGPPVVAAALAVAQARLGHDVHLLTYAGGPDNPDGRGVLRGMADGERVHLHAVQRSSAARWWPRQANAALAQLIPHAAVVHIHGVWPTICLGAGRVSRRAGVPYVVLPHGSLNDWTLAERALKKKIALAVAFGSFVAGAAWVHATSEYEARCVRDGDFHTHVKVFPPGIDPELLGPPPAADAFARRRPVLAGARYVVFIARLHPGKGADLLVEAIALLRQRGTDLHAVIAGPDAGARAAVEAAIARTRTGDRVHLIGPIWGTEKTEALAGALAFCLPSKGESFGMSIAEALAVGTPVVISGGCHFEQAERAGAGIIVERTPEAIADGLSRLAADEPLRKRFSAAGRALVAERYAWPSVAAGIVDAYQHSPS